MRLYDLDVSGNCYKVRLYAALLNIPLTLVPVDFANGEQLREPLISYNPFGEIPILEDSGIFLRDSQAILVYLARKWGDQRMLPEDPLSLARVVSWLSVAANEVRHGPEAARRIRRFHSTSDPALAGRRSEALLRLLDRHLSAGRFLTGDDLTLADVAVFPYVALAPEGGIELAPYPQVLRWIARIKAEPGFIGMPGID